MRAKTGTVRRQGHKKVLNRTKGMRMSKGRLFRISKEADLHAGQYSYIGRKLKKRNFRKLWIQRINAALNPLNLKYSVFIKKLSDNKIELNRKILADIAVHDQEGFKKIVNKLK
ncbi:50S ribosomal protein L20 [Candidatus Beckwithbacteria bacterium CG10_big_fil_rev_8_21_14_0_10_34_10]|uniref:Large ribosomal subunit protein bL20 n=1 Tax=Candidatus Beckwithbacteria bacterium CG10_big_fil_rev_8_21_14_0_10_34_10 TaxID=1974495 RepID=A0A2H0WAI4_9BACT|nr:MAG: 50S ribosomal protein L20 [Candidatus Beckwithbacteria bacterium CG10_big_fil_rev_8_21_14_0_10_34_10]